MKPAELPQKLRLWPGVVFPLVALSAVFLPGFVIPGTMVQFLCIMLGPAVALIGLTVWWLWASRAPGRDRLMTSLMFVLGGAVAAFAAHASMPFGLYMFALPSVGLVFTLWLYASRGRDWRMRRVGAWVAILIGWGFWITVRCDGIDGRFIPNLSWRWTLTAEERYLAALRDVPPPAANAAAIPASLEESETDWPGFRGRDRDSRVTNFLVDSDWKRHPPKELWRRPIGPGWSSFAVVGGRAFTQEQRAEQEMVLCLDADTGRELWSYATATRFWEVVGGAGPRATPTFSAGRIYALGATGALVCLDAVSGEKRWSRDITIDGRASAPQWGIASSPLVINGRVYVSVGSGTGKSVLAYDADNGGLLWSAGDGGHSYSSPHGAEFGGVPQVLMVTGKGVMSLAPEDGHVLWDHSWETPGYRVVQPNVVGNQVLIGTNNGMGTRLINVQKAEDAWNGEEAWTSRGLKPYFNDFVVHDGHVYGFDNSILVCLDLETGKRRWKGGRYGTGQMLLLPEQSLLLISTEITGEVVLVEAKPDRHVEIARHKVLKGKTWNHPVIAGGRLFVRNGEQAACFELTELKLEGAPLASTSR